MGNNQLKKSSNVPALTEENLEFLIRNTNFDREQLIEWHQSFHEDCPSGLMDLDLFVKFYSKLHPNSNNPEQFCKRIFKVFDANNNKTIEFNELIMAVSVISLGNLDQQLNLAFQIYDLDTNGFLNETEMKKVIGAIFELTDNKCHSPETTAKSIMEKFDKNNDQKLSREEFVLGCLRDPTIRNLIVPFS